MIINVKPTSSFSKVTLTQPENTHKVLCDNNKTYASTSGEKYSSVILFKDEPLSVFICPLLSYTDVNMAAHSHFFRRTVTEDLEDLCREKICEMSKSGFFHVEHILVGS